MKRSLGNHDNNVIKNKKEETTMKRNHTTSRIVAFLLAAMMLIMPLAGCMNNQQQKDEFLDTVNQTTSATTTQKVENPDTGALAGEKDSAENNSDLQKQLDEALAKLETLEKEKAEAEKKAAEAVEESKKAEAEVTKLEAEKAALKEQGELPVEVVEGKIFVNLEYALDDMTVNFDDGTAALMATEKGIEVIVDFDEAVGSKTVYRDNYVSLPREDYRYAVTYDGKTVYSVNTGKAGQEYSYANGGLFLGGKMSTGYKLQDTQLRGSFGTTDDLLQVVIVAIEDSSAEYGYRFRVKAGNYSPNASKPSQKPSNPQPSKPVTPEKETVTITVTETKLICKICGKEDCAGHCGKCHAPIPYCTCKPDTVIVVKCPICGLEGCNGHKETVYVPGDTVYVPVPGETIVIPGGTIEVCHKCKKPIEDCICTKDPANNSTNEGKNDLIDGILDTTPQNNSTNTGFQGLVEEMKEQLNNSTQNNGWLPNGSSSSGTTDEPTSGKEDASVTDEWQANGTTSGNNQNNGSTSSEVESGNSTNTGWNSSESGSNDTWNPNANATSNSGFGDLVASLK